MKKEHMEKINIAEKTAIAYCLGGSLHEAINMGLKPEMFVDKAYHEIFSAMIRADVSGKGVSLETIAAAIKNLGEVSLKLAECMEVHVTSTTKWAIKSLVNSFHLRNDLIKLREIYNDGVNADPTEEFPLGERILAVVDMGSRNDGKTHSSADGLVVKTISNIERDIEEGGMLGIKTGIAKIDVVLGGGLKPNRIYTIAARPGSGKTTMATNIMQNAAESGIATFYATIELDHFEVTERLLCRAGQIDTQTMSTRNFNDDDMDRLAEASKKVNKINYFVNSTTGGDWERLISIMRFHAMYRNVKLFVIDYIQQWHVRGKKLTAREEITQMTGEIKAFAMEHKCAVIMVAQMNRNVESRKDKVPMLSDLKESGSIEQDSDVVIMLSLEESKNGMREPSEVLVAYVAKNRQGKTGSEVLEVNFSTNTIHMG